ncbi:MAG: bacterioferritin [Cyanomargarita calcarea GSE-NOS-MK-12-04C]|jgi:bacterioferritin|uniref:Bacterioferritin n=1 Tax=Cyanomargarita calcarea GSE-NOS-MK-12-04C TaxID=2839659 RepID=A0A951QJC7_9CYAN|nr:bacterioferritin [Cyanomargarita calcarea GSE-NOS-MK-12-04C]
MKQLDHQKTIELLQTIMEFEFAGVIRYTQYCLVASSSNVTSIVDFLQEQASESLTHAQLVGKFIISFNAYPKPRIAPIEEINEYSVKTILTASQSHEAKALELYKVLLEVVRGSNIKLEEFLNKMITEEGSHHQELEQMIQDLA